MFSKTTRKPKLTKYLSLSVLAAEYVFWTYVLDIYQYNALHTYISTYFLTSFYSYNRISDVANYDLKSLLNLQELKLMANNIIDLQKGALRHLTGLQSLDLSRNRIEVLQFGQFAGLSGLRIVNLSHNR